MIRPRNQQCVIADGIFDTAYAAIVKSGVAQRIEDYYADGRQPGGRPSSGITYTVTAVMTALLVRFMMSRPHSLRGAMDTIGEFTANQLTAVGMGGEDCVAITADAATEYHRLERFWRLRMQPIDPDFDLPAFRMTNAEFAARLKARTPADRDRSELANQRLTTLINDLLYGSIQTDTPPNCDGDVVVDETIIDTANPRSTLGTRPDKYRGASSIAAYWARDKKKYIIELGTYGDVRTNGFGVGATFVSRVGRRDALHSEPALFVGMDVHHPTSGSVDGLATALKQARRTGLDCRKGGRSRTPQLTADMGYNPKTGFGELMLEMGYSPVVRYPQHWNVEYPSANPSGGPTGGPPPGPIQYAGAFFCPAVMTRIRGHRTPATKEFLKNDQFRAHDTKLRAIYPFLMGYHSRPTIADIRHGRPRIGSTAERRAKIRLVCPAALGSIQCPLKPESMNGDQIGLPQAEPDWPAEAKACCCNSSTTVYLTDDQLRMAQWDLVPGSWEHTLYYEAARALTEQRFSQLKSKYVAGLDDLTTGPRRTPMIKIAIALAAAAVNIRAQQNHDRNSVREESIDVRMRQLTNDLGHPPVAMPRRS